MPSPVGKGTRGQLFCVLLAGAGGKVGHNLTSSFLTALSKAAEVYFKAIEKIAEQALQSSTSHVLGKASLLTILCPETSHS